MFFSALKTVLKILIAGFVGGVVGTIVERIIQYDEEIKELYSRLEDCEEKNSETENRELKKLFQKYITMSDNKLVKTILDAATLTGLAAGIGWIAKKVVKENFTADPSYNVMNYSKFMAVMAGSIAFKNYLQDQNILPNYV